MIFNIIKTLHIISVISWMAGLLYLPRIFVYHADSKIKKETSETFMIMERRLYYFIMTPAAIVSLLTGIMMVSYFSLEMWLILKIVLVLVLLIFHFYCGKWLKLFSINQNKNTVNFFRLRNEVPTILLILIVILVIFKPY